MAFNTKSRVETVLNIADRRLAPHWGRTAAKDVTYASGPAVPVSIFHVPSGKLMAVFRGRGRLHDAVDFCACVDELGDWSTEPPRGAVMAQICEIANGIKQR